MRVPFLHSTHSDIIQRHDPSDRYRLPTVLATLLIVSLALGLFVLSPASAHAQNLPLPEQSYVNEFARPGQPTITLYLWGTVGTTGIWRVERNVDLIQLLSVARVPGVGTSQRDVRQKFILHIYRQQSGERQEIYEEEIENLIGGGAAAVPALQDGDILAVETQTRRRIGLNFLFTTLRTVSSFLSLYLLLRREF